MGGKAVYGVGDFGGGQGALGRAAAIYAMLRCAIRCIHAIPYGAVLLQATPPGAKVVLTTIAPLWSEPNHRSEYIGHINAVKTSTTAWIHKFGTSISILAILPWAWGLVASQQAKFDTTTVTGKLKH